MVRFSFVLEMTPIYGQAVFEAHGLHQYGYVSWFRQFIVKSRKEIFTDALTNLCNAPPTWLDLAHKRLDEAVFAAYGWKFDLSDEKKFWISCWR